jgi:hypothetical protein
VLRQWILQFYRENHVPRVPPLDEIFVCNLQTKFRKFTDENSRNLHGFSRNSKFQIQTKFQANLVFLVHTRDVVTAAPFSKSMCLLINQMPIIALHLMKYR